MKKRILTALLALVMILGTLSVAAAERTGTRVHYEHKFDSVPVSEKWSSNTSGLGMSYATGTFRGVSGKDAIQNRSVAIKRCDMRWWNVSYFDEKMGFSFQFKLDENFGGALHLSVNTQDTATSTEGMGGIAVSVAKSGGKPILKDHGGKKLADLTEGNHTVEVLFKRNSNIYTVKLDNEVLTETAKFRSPVSHIYGMRVQMDPGASDEYIVLDNFKAYTIGRLPAQTHSYQEKGRLPEVTIPTPPENRIYAFVDHNEVDLSKTRAIAEEGTVFLPLQATLTAAGAAFEAGTGDQTVITLGETKAVAVPGMDIVRYGDSYIKLNHALKVEKDVVFAPLQFFAELLDAKVWYDANTKNVVISTGKHKNDNILRLYNGQFFQNGEAFYEISFNKFDLNMQLDADGTLNGKGGYSDQTWNNAQSCLAGAEKALKELSENGFKTIRVFCSNQNLNKNQKEVDAYWKTVDKMYDLCDHYGIQVVACMSLTTEEFLDGSYVGGTWVTKDENYFDYFTKPDCASRKNAYAFLTEYVNRYKDRDTILMWEICNEGNLGVDIGAAVGSVAFSLIQLGEFYNDFAKLFHELDPERLVTGGDSMLRSAQWHLLSAVLKGNAPDWTADTVEERKKALMLLHEELDVISIHGYDVGYNTASGHGLTRYPTKRGYRDKVITYDFYVDEALSLNKGLYNGEAGGQMGKSYANTSKKAAEQRAIYLKSIVDAGVQLTHWWSYGSNRNGGFGNDMDTWNVTIKGTPDTFAAIKQANADLKAKWQINAAEGENTTLIASGTFVEHSGNEFALPETEAQSSLNTGDSDEKGGCGSMASLSLTLVLLPALLPLAVKRKRSAD